MSCKTMCRFHRQLKSIFNKQILRLSNSNYMVHHSRDCSQSSYYDVIISGGGMVGTAMAAALGNEGILSDTKILLLEAGTPTVLNQAPSNYSSRTCALSPSTVNLLESFGAWKRIQEMRYKEVKRMQVWDSCSDAMISFNHDDLTDNLAYIVENEIILSAIAKQVTDMGEKVEVRNRTKVQKYNLSSTTSSSSGLVTLELDNGEILSTKLLIGADGFRSLLRQNAGIHTMEWDYKQMAVCATLHLAEGSENNVAWQRFLKTGPIAMLPVSDKFSCLIWTTTPTNARNLLKLTPESFVDAVNDAFWQNLDKNPLIENVSRSLDSLITTVGLDGSSTQQLPPTIIDVDAGSQGMFPLSFVHASQYVKPRMALIGDAAHRCHPLAGQGVNMGFGDVACLRDQIITATSNGQDIGSLSTLLEYETQRQRNVLPTMMAVDGLNKLYSNDWTPLVLLRTLGCQATHALGPLKKFMISHATN